MTDLVLRGRLLAADLDRQGGLYIKDGVIERLLEAEEESPDSAVRELDFGDAYIAPAFIDMFGFVSQDKDLLLMEQQEAAAGGFSHLLCVPTPQLPLDSLESVLWLNQQSDKVRLLPVAGLTRNLKEQTMSQLAKLKQAGAVAFSLGRTDLDNTRVLLNCYKYLSSIDGLLVVSPRDSYLGEGYIADDEVAWQTGLAAVSDLAETIAVQRHLMLIREAGVRAHFSAISRVESLKVLAGSGIPPSADISLPHLVFNAADITNYDPVYYIDPALGSRAEQQLMYDKIQQYPFIRGLSSLHLSLLRDDLLVPIEFARPGMAIRALFLSLALNLVREEVLELRQLISMLTSYPAETLRLESGYLRPGAPASVCVFDKDRPWTVTRASYSAANTPLMGSNLTGKVLLTMNEGEVTYQDSFII